MIAAELELSVTPAIEPHVDAIADRVSAVIAPPPAPRSLLEFSRTVRTGEGKTREERDRLVVPEGHAPQYYILRAFDSGRYRIFITVGPAQDGKSLITINIPIAYVLIELQQHVAYGGPDRALLNKLWRQKLRRLIRASGYGHLLPKDGPGSGGGAADDIQFGNGAVLFIIGAGAQNEAAQSAATAQKSFIEERDSVREHWVELIRKRTSGQGLDSWDVQTSTIKKDRGSLTLAALDETTRCAVQFACMRCGGFQLFGLEGMKGEWDNAKAARATVGYKCAHCGELLTPDQHLLSLQRHRQVSVALDGQVREVPDLDAYGMRWSAFDSPRKGLLYLATEYSRAWVQREKHFNHQPMKQFYRDEAALPYLEEEVTFGESISDRQLAEISSKATYKKGEIPDEAQVFGVGEDCQLRSHYYLSVAFKWIPEGERLRWWIIDWDELSVCGAADMPRLEQRHGILDKIDHVYENGYTVQGGNNRRMPASFAAVDTAFYPREIRPWVAAKGRGRWLSMRGCGPDQFGAMGREPRRGSVIASVKNAIQVYEQDDAPDRLQGFADANSLNDEIEASLQTGDGHLPVDADNRLAYHLRGIERNPDPDGKPWRPRHRRHDYRDCLVYVIARARLFFTMQPSANRTYGVLGSLLPRK